MAQKFLSDIDFAEDLPRPLPVWRVSPSEIRDSIKPHPPDRGKKRARDRGRLWIGVNETNWPKKRARKHPKLSPMTRYAKPEFGIQPPPLSPSLLLSFLSSPPFSSSSPGINNRAAFFFARRRQGAPATDSITYVHVAHVPRVFYDHHRLCFRSLTKRDETWYVVAKVWREKRDDNFWTDLGIGCLCFWGWEILAFSKRFYSKCLRDVKIIVA